VAAVRRTLKRFPDVVSSEIDLKRQRAIVQVRSSFDQYVALEEAVQEGGGAIRMFHARYLIPEPIYAMLAGRQRDPGTLDDLQRRLQAVPGVRSAFIDPERWFTNDQGLHVGGAAIFADRDRLLDRNLEQAARDAGFILEPRMDGPAVMHDKEWSETNHRVAGLFLLLLTGLGVLQLSQPQPSRWVRYGTLGVWLGMFLFLSVRSDPEYWPIGQINWFDGFKDLESCQHRLGIGLIVPIVLGDFWRLRRGWKLNPALGHWGILTIAGVGGGMLFTHLHTTIDPAHAVMVRRMNLEHLAMATAVLGIAVSKFAWDRWRVPRRGGQYLWLVCLGLLGFLLNLYVE
jgi:hypothetical protein